MQVLPVVRRKPMDPVLKTAGWIAIVGSVLCIAFRVPLVDTAAVLAILAFVGMCLLWLKTPRVVRKMLTAPGVRWMVDLGASATVPLFMGATITGITAGMIVGIYVSIGLEWQAEKFWGP